MRADLAVAYWTAKW